MLVPVLMCSGWTDYYVMQQYEGKNAQKAKEKPDVRNVTGMVRIT
jgi:hypothetical protein